MGVCMTVSDFLKKYVLPKKGGNEPKIGFFEFIEKFVY